MAYSVTDEIRQYLPPNSIDVRPLDYAWAEAVNAIVFVSTNESSSFESWQLALEAYYRKMTDGEPILRVESHPELGCSFWFDSSPQVDIHVARCKSPDSIDTLNSWLGSDLLLAMAAAPYAETAGIIRIRPE